MSSLKIGKVLFHIGYAGVDKETKEVNTPVLEKPDKTNSVRRGNDFMKPYGFTKRNIEKQ